MVQESRGGRDDSATPNLHGRYGKFWSGITRGPITRLHEFVGLAFKPIRETEVRDYRIPLPVKEEILELEVAMNDLFLVNVQDARDELTKEFACILLLEVTVGKYVVEEFTAGRVLEYDTDVLVRFDNVV